MDSFAWSNDIRKIKEDADEIIRLKEKEKHARYYKKNRKQILKKQKEADKIRDRKSKEYYQRNKDAILATNTKRYWDNVDERRRKAREYYQAHKDEIRRRRRMLTREKRLRALVGNIKNWSWDIYPKFSIDKEDADALIEHFRTLGKQEKNKKEQTV